jgi:DNA-binding IclR family transcriptional regulator
LKVETRHTAETSESESRLYSAPALEKGLDILELLAHSEQALTQKDMALRLGRSVGEIYRMVACLVYRNYLAVVDDTAYVLTTKMFELAHASPPTHRLLLEAQPIMQRLAGELEQSCHLTVYGQGKQVVLHKVDSPTGMGFAVRTGAELDVLLSASGRVLLAFQNDETRQLQIEESLQRKPEQANPQIENILETIRATGYESIPSSQVRGLYAVSFPVLDTAHHAIAALTVPYAERIDQTRSKTIPEVTAALREAAHSLSTRVGGRS